MMPGHPSSDNYWYGPYEGYELRCQRRIQKDLGVLEIDENGLWKELVVSR